MTKFKVNGLQIENKRTQSYKNPVTVNWVHEYKLQGNAVASVEGANGNVKIDIETLSEDTQEQIKQLLKNIELEVNGKQLTKNLVIVDKEYIDKFTKTGLATLHKGEVFLNKKQVDELLQSAEKINERLSKDQTVNLTINVDYKGSEKDIDNIASTIVKRTEEAMRKNGFNRR